MTPEQNQRIFDICWLIGMILAVACFIVVIITPVQSAPLVKQGDIIYMEETLDLSLAASWPDFTLAWCSGTYTCDNPDVTIDLSKGDMENYYIDPEAFQYGTWYRWDGSWHRGENAVAFKINPGKRPKAVPTIAANETEPDSVAIRDPEGPFYYLIARGDGPLFSVRLDRAEPCHLWVFSGSDSTYNIPLEASAGTNTHQFTSAETAGIQVGSYQGYIQCDGNNGWQDIFYENSILDTPYDNRLVKDVVLSPALKPSTVKELFDGLTQAVPKFDDTLYPIEFAVTIPSSTISEVTQDENTLFIEGTTSWADGTVITIRLDPDNYALAKDIASHTWKVTASGSISAHRTFTMPVPLNKNELSIGPHQIVASVAKNGYTSDSSYEFKVTDLYVMPTPTPEAKRAIFGKDYEGIPVKVAQTPTPEPAVEITEEITPEPVPDPIDVVITPTDTPIPATPEPTPQETIPTIPVSPLIPFSAVCLIILVRGRVL